MTDINLAISFLAAQSALSLLTLFFYTIAFEIPRYGFPFLALVLEPLVVRFIGNRRHRSSARGPVKANPSVSVIVVGHNEESSIESCVRSLRAQSFADFEIVIVSDGSSDRMVDVSAALVKQGLADRLLSTDLRGGKSAGLNLAVRYATGDIIINVDCDCSYDEFAIEEMLKAFADPTIAAVCGDIVPRNGDRSLIARFQEIEYLLAISVGKRIGSSVDQVVCMSGAFSAFRREALDEIGGFDVGGGEDLDITLRLRAHGWRVGFASGAICYTDVPESLWILVRQRLRWERDAVRLRYRKFRDQIRPWSPRFILTEALHHWEFLIFSVVGAILFPFYVIWLFMTYGSFALVILTAMQIGLLVLDVVMLAMADMITNRPIFWSNLLYMPGFTIFTSYFMRFVRLVAYLEEWLLFGSIRDNYVPAKVRLLRKW